MVNPPKFSQLGHHLINKSDPPPPKGGGLHTEASSPSRGRSLLWNPELLGHRALPVPVLSPRRLKAAVPRSFSMASGDSGSNFNIATAYLRPRNQALRSLTLKAGHSSRIGRIKAWDRLTMNIARLALV